MEKKHGIKDEDFESIQTVKKEKHVTQEDKLRNIYRDYIGKEKHVINNEKLNFILNHM